jgi:hypothetical protein
MKTKIQLIAPAMLLLSLMSCSKYYINTVSSSNMLKNERTGEFKLETDSVRISYGFSAEDARLNVKVFNKLAVPVYVDWGRSSIIYKGKAIAFVPDKVSLSGNISTSTWNDRRLSYGESTINGSIQTLKEVTFIPPNSGVETTARFLDSDVFNSLADSLYQDTELVYTDLADVKVKVANFDHSNSPLSFRSYLTLYTQEGQKNNVFSFDREFFVSKSVKTGTKPHNIVNYNPPTADVFYNSKRTGYGKTMAGVGVAAAIVGTAALVPEQPQK